MDFLKRIGFKLLLILLMFTPALIFIIGLSMFLTGETVEPSPHVKANRYTNCIERQSAQNVLTYDEMKEVCGEYLK